MMSTLKFQCLHEDYDCYVDVAMSALSCRSALAMIATLSPQCGVLNLSNNLQLGKTNKNESQENNVIENIKRKIAIFYPHNFPTSFSQPHNTLQIR